MSNKIIGQNNEEEFSPKKKQTFGVVKPKKSNKTTKVAAVAVAGAMVLAAIAVPTVIHFSGKSKTGNSDVWTVTINYGEVGTNKTLTVKAGDKISQITAERIPGYYFAGYCEDEDLTKYLDPETIINENKTIYLNYIAIKYSFENIPEGINITTLDGQEKVSVTEDTKLFYNQEINLSYTVKAGHHLTNLKITGLEQVSDLQLINNDDNSLTYSSNYVVKGFSSDDAREVNLGLNYTQDVNIYTLTFNNEGEITTQNVAYNELAQITTNPSKEKDPQYEYSFKGWTLNPKADEDSELVNLNTFHVTENTTLYAVYTKTLRTYYINLDSSYPTECVVISRLDNNKWVELKHDAALHYGDFITVSFVPTIGNSVVEERSGITSGVKVGFVDTNGKNMYMVTGEVAISYEEQASKFTITYTNEAGETLATVTTAEYGNSIATLYTGTTPSKASTQDNQYTYNYTFTGWSATTVEGDVTVTPVFAMTSVAREYTIAEIPADVTVEFVSGTSSHKAGDKLTTASKLHYGDEIKVRYAFETGLQLQSFVVKGITESESTGTSVGSVSGYIQGTITGEVTITCANEQTTYNVIYVNADGSVLLLTTAKHGASVVETYTGETPTKASTQDERNIYTYTFSGWSTSTITENNMQITPNFTTTTVARKFVVTYLDEAGTTLATVSTAEYGNNIASLYTGTTPSKASTQDERNTYTYTFSGWSATTVEGDTTVTPVFTTATVARNYTITTNKTIGGNGSLTVFNKTQNKTTTNAHYGDELTITYKTSAGYKMENFNIQGIEILNRTTSGNTTTISCKVMGAVTVTYEEVQVNYVVNFDENHLTVTVNGTTISSGSTVTYGTKLAISYTESAGHTKQSIKVNGKEITTSYTVTDEFDSINIIYSETINKVTIKYYDYDGTLLETTQVNWGTTATRANPTRAADNTYTYTFNKWVTSRGGTTPANLKAVVENTSVYASYNQTYISYKITSIPSGVRVTYVSGTSGYSSNTTLSTSSNFHYGDTLKVSYTSTTGKKMTSFSVNGITSSSTSGTSAGNTSGYIQGYVRGNLTLGYSEEYIEYTLSSIPEHVTVTYISGTSANEENSVLTTSSTYHYGDILKISYQVEEEGYAKSTFSISNFTSTESSTSDTTSGYIQGRVTGIISINYTEQYYLTFSSVTGGYSVSGLRVSSVTDVIIPETYNGQPVVGISSSAFYNKSSLKSVQIPDSVTSIGNQAFYGCSVLTDVNIPNAITSIGSSAFYNCSSITSITIPEGVTSIASSAFSGCSALTDVNIPNTITSIGSSAFYNCTNLTSITIPEGVTSIGQSAFYNCTALEIVNYNATAITDFSSNSNVFYNAGANSEGIAVTFGDNVTKIPAYLFYVNSSSYAPKITSVVIGNNVTSIGSSAFYNCTSLTEIYYNAINATAEGYCFVNAGKDADGIVVIIGEDVTTIPKELFSKAKNGGFSGNTESANITNVVMGSKVTSIGDYAFYMCSGLTEITMSEKVTSIGKDAFGYCSSLTEITIPEKVTSIGKNAFEACGNLTKINFNATACNDLSSNSTVFSWAGINGEGISITFGDNVTKIPSYLFYPYYNPSYSPKITSVVIGASVTSIGGMAFSDCITLNDVTINSRTIYDALTSDTAHGNLLYYATTIKTSKTADDGTNSYLTTNYNKAEHDDYYVYTLKNMDSQGLVYTQSGENYIIKQYSGVATEVIIPDTYNGKPVVGMRSYAFYRLSHITSVTLPNTITSISYQAFYDCSSLTSITIPEGLTSIGTYAFYGCSSLTSITIPEGVTSIGDWTFYNCTSLTEITIPDSVTSIGEYAFQGCTRLTEITIGEGVTSIGSLAFCSCTSLTSITIPEKVTSIGNNAFAGCYNLTQINFNATACKDLSSNNRVFMSAGRDGEGINVTFGNNVTKIPAYLFYPDSYDSSYTPKITSVTIGESVISIGSSAFYNCTSLTSVTIESDNAYKNATSTTNCGYLLQNATTVKVLKTVADKEGNTNTYLNGTGFTRTEEGDYYIYTKN